ncbi:MAG: hypothetical protein KTQ49_05595 [Candidatus Omnitrophica bacterium]|nr:hypothetical protein [Candidatus Omnitrophota bacterium]
MRQKYGDPQKYVVDPEFGFRPILEKGIYNRWGTLANSYSLDKKPSGVTRLLFIGDSVTATGHIVAGLKKVYGEDKFEYWNAGVRGFNTIQEVKFYKKYNQPIKPDHVILTFHLNDFETTPVAFFNSERRLTVFAPELPSKTISPFWFQKSMLYRLCLGIVIKAGLPKREHIDREVAASLAELRDILARDRIDFTVLINPTCKPSNEWNDWDKKAKKKERPLLRVLGIKNSIFLQH